MRQFLRVAWVVMRKDLTVEMRTREIVYTTVFFAASCVLVFAFALVKEGKPMEDAAAAILWISIAFAGTLALGRTFDEYLAGFRRRRRGEIDWNNYSAYEIRIVGALVQLGRRDDAAELMEFLMGDRRPRAWNQWPEISWRDPRSPGHLGDVPHTWIGAEYLLALRSMLAYEREFDHALVLAAGVPQEWALDRAGIGVQRLPSYYGVLSYTLKPESTSTDDHPQLRLQLSGDLDVPPGGIVVRSPLKRPLSHVVVNGRRLESFSPHEAVIRTFPADIVLSY